MSNGEFGGYIRAQRKKKKLTIGELAEKANISPSYLSQIETGNRAIPTDEVLLMLSRGLQIDYSTMLEVAGRKAGVFDSYIRSFIHLLLGNRDHPFYDEILQSFKKQIGAIFKKYKIESNTRITIVDESGLRGDVPDQYTDMIVRIDNDQFKLDVFRQLRNIAHDFHFEFNPRRYDDLVEFTSKLEHELNSLAFIIAEKPDLHYNEIPLDSNDRQRILDMLKVLFPDRQ